MSKVLPCFRFSQKEGKWIEVEVKKESVAVESFKVVTLNQWFDRKAIKERTNYQLKDLKKMNPDVICFQESMNCILLIKEGFNVICISN